MAKPSANHLLGRLLERPVGSGVDQPLGEVVANELCVEILIGAAGVQQVALGDDAWTAGLGVRHDRCADVGPRHPPGRLAQRVRGPDRHDHAVHPVSDIHV